MAELDAYAGRELVLARQFDAPRERVFDAWCDPAHIGQWWGPDGFSMDIEAMEVRAGGEFRFTLHGADGSDHRGRIVYAEVARPGRLRYERGADGGVPFSAEATFAAQGAGTLLTLRMMCASPQQLEQLKQEGAVQGAEQTLERLDRYLAGYGSEM